MNTDKGNRGSNTTPEQALESSLVAMERGTGLPLEHGLRKKIEGWSIQKFKDNHANWPAFEKKVLRSAQQIGTYAEAFARFDAEINGKPAPVEIKQKHAAEAIRVVSKLCPAGASEIENFFKWCPEPEA